MTAMVLAGSLTFDPKSDTIDGVSLKPPQAEALPASFETDDGAYEAPAADPDSVTVIVSPESERLQLLEPFSAWDGNDFDNMPILLKAKGKCTTDHISPAGPWLRFRGHLDNISDNMFSGAANAFTDEPGTGVNALTGERGVGLSALAREYKRQGLGWIVIGDENYGEGSSREHAAMEPRHLGCRAVLVKSFARIHETNLKKQGILPMTFVNAADYDLFREDDRVSVSGLAGLAPGSELTVVLHHADGSTDTVTARHSMSAQQIEWFKAGSALNMIAAAQA